MGSYTADLNMLDVTVAKGDQLGELLRGDPPAGLPGDVTQTDRGEQRLRSICGDVLLRLSREQFREPRLEPVGAVVPAWRVEPVRSLGKPSGRRRRHPPRSGDASTSFDNGVNCSSPGVRPHPLFDRTKQHPRSHVERGCRGCFVSLVGDCRPAPAIDTLAR